MRKHVQITQVEDKMCSHQIRNKYVNKFLPRTWRAVVSSIYHMQIVVGS